VESFTEFQLDFRPAILANSCNLIALMRFGPTFRLLVIASALLYVGEARAANPYPYGPDTLPNGAINIGPFIQQFTVLSNGGDISLIDNTFTGPSYVKGNMGIAGAGNFSMSDGTIDGDLVYHTGAKVSLSGPAKVTGHQYSDAAHNTILSQAASDSQGLSDLAAMELSSPQYASITNVNISNVGQSMTIMGGPNQKIVLNLQNFVMSAGTFTLQGTATTSFIINITNQFSLNNSQILLSGVPPANVLFNIRGTGSQVSLNQGTSMSGFLLATKRKVDLSGGKIFGRLVANQINITSGGQVVSQ